MTGSKFRFYYWHIMTALVENTEFLSPAAVGYRPPDEFLVESRGHIKATIIFRNGSRLITLAELDDTTEIREYNYAPHHPAISTYPGHMHKGEPPIVGKDQAHELDIPQVDFATVLGKIVDNFLTRKH